MSECQRQKEDQTTVKIETFSKPYNDSKKI